MKKLILYTLLCSMTIQLYSQRNEEEPLTRIVKVSQGDSVIVAGILIRHKEVTPGPDLTYFWYSGGAVNFNVAGFAGELLHGDYKIFDPEQHLIVKGGFSHGLKDGAWKYWFSNGKLLRTENWKKGEKTGETVFFDRNGSKVVVLKYRNGKLKDSLNLEEDAKPEENTGNGWFNLFQKREVTVSEDSLKQEDQGSTVQK
ncbi:MAG TPA: hypothetical protein VE912_17805 [Bacteroidales bacterium]|nr:hypothetical protein [Bacteroidales bacterium]